MFFFQEEADLSEFEEIELPKPQQQSQQQSQGDLSQQQQERRQPKQAPGFTNSGQAFGFQAPAGPAKFGASFSDISGNINPLSGAPQFPGLQNRNPFGGGQFSNNQVRNPFSAGALNNNIFRPNNSPTSTRQGSLGAAFNSPGG